MENKQSGYSDFIAAAMQFLADRPDSAVMIVVDGPKGFETLRSVPSFAWALGAIRMADDMMYRGLEESRDRQVENKQNQEVNDQIDAAVSANRRKAN